MTRTEGIAIYAAILSSLLACWNVYSFFRSGARLKVRLSANMISTGDTGPTPQKYLLAVISNVGRQPTTITHITMEYFPTLLSRVRHRPEHQYFALPAFVQLPFVLAAGGITQGGLRQTEQLEKLSQRGRLYVLVTDAVHRNPRRVRVPPIKKSEEPAP